MIKAIIFDFDGVIVESAEIKTQAFQKLFEHRFPKHIDEIVQYHKKNMGISRFVKFKHVYSKFAGKTLTEDEEAHLGEEFSSIVFDQVLKTEMVDGAIEFLNENQQKHLLFVASGTPKEELLDIMKRRDLFQYFKEVFGSPEDKKNIIKQIMKKYELKSSEIVFVGDAQSDLDAASATGVHFIARVKKESLNLKECQSRIFNLNELNKFLNQLR